MLDVTPPSIVLSGANYIILEAGRDQYHELGFLAVDSADGDKSDSVQIASTLPDVAQLGNYTIRYAVVDRAGNQGSAIRNVAIVDTIPPVITLLGASSIKLTYNTSWKDPGFSALDSFDGNISFRVVVSGDFVNITQHGVYTALYDVIDDAGNRGLTRHRMVVVLPADKSGASSASATSTIIPIVIAGAAILAIFIVVVILIRVRSKKTQSKAAASEAIKARFATRATVTNTINPIADLSSNEQSDHPYALAMSSTDTNGV